MTGAAVGPHQSRSVVLVEGRSDQVALEALAARRGIDLVASGVLVQAIGGATWIGRYLDRFGPTGDDRWLSGLCDRAEEQLWRYHLERAGVGVDLDRAGMERAGFFVCDADLEEELIRALGPEAVEDVIAAAGDLGAWRTMRKQPFHRGRDVDAQLRRFMGTHSGRKERYARLLVDALDLAAVPRPLDGVLAHGVASRRGER